MLIYRVLVRETGSRQPAGGGTTWSKTVAYCGYDRAEARRVFWELEATDCFCGYGNRCRETVVQQIEEGASVEDEAPETITVEDD